MRMYSALARRSSGVDITANSTWRWMKGGGGGGGGQVGMSVYLPTSNNKHPPTP